MILIIDIGSQYTHLIKRNCRDMDFEAEIIQNSEPYEKVKEQIKSAEKIILSGGPSSVYAKSNGLAEEIVKEYKEGTLTQPLLGICFGHQLITHVFGGTVAKGAAAEYGISEISVDKEGTLFKNVPKKFKAWVSHFDEAKKAPKEFKVLAHSSTCKIESMEHETKKIYSVQFHPEVWHTEHGETILKNFLTTST